MLYFSYVLQKATIQNNQIPEFKKVKIALNIKDVFDYLENAPIDIKDGFVYSNYSHPRNVKECI